MLDEFRSTKYLVEILLERGMQGYIELLSMGLIST